MQGYLCQSVSVQVNVSSSNGYDSVRPDALSGISNAIQPSLEPKFSLVPAMRFMIVTDDEDAARRLFPSMEIHHFSPEKDYVTLKNARYLILSNSSFGFFPAVTSKTLKKAIAPKYWARHNVSDGYWASEQNIYEGFSYLGRDGKLYSARQCREELSRYVFPETHPWDPEDPMVEKVRKKNHRAWLAGRIAGRAGRMLGLIR